MTKQAIPRLVPEASQLDLGADTRSPIDVLRAQLDYWKEATNGKVLGQVEATTSRTSVVAYWFGFVVPAMDNYRHRLLLVEHGLEFYPAWISSGPDETDQVQVENEEELFAELGKRFKSEETRRIVRQLSALAAEARG